MFAELFHEMLQTKYITSIVKSLQVHTHSLTHTCLHAACIRAHTYIRSDICSHKTPSSKDVFARWLRGVTVIKQYYTADLMQVCAFYHMSYEGI